MAIPGKPPLFSLVIYILLLLMLGFVDFSMKMYILLELQAYHAPIQNDFNFFD